MIDVGGTRNERKKWIHSFDAIASMIYCVPLNHYCEVLFEEETRNAMWESIDLFQNILDGKWFNKSPIIIYLTKEDIFRYECVMVGYRLSDCFDADPYTHPRAEWIFAYDPQSRYTDIEFDPNATFQPTETLTAQEVKDLHLEDVIHTQMEFIEDIFLRLAEAYGRIRNHNVFIHSMITCTDKDLMRKLWDVTVYNTVFYRS